MPADATPSLLYVPELAAVGALASLPEDEIHYLVRVCRARPGDRVEATDGAGGRATLAVESVRPDVVLRVESLRRAERARTAWVLAGPPEHGRADWMVEKLAELGIAVFQPLDLARGRFTEAVNRHERWQRLAVAAMRQSRSAHRLDVRPALPLDRVLERLPEGARRWYAAPDAPRRPAPAMTGGVIDIGLIGGASGLDDDEKARVEAQGFEPISLADNRLRTETAAMAWAAWWAAGIPAAHNV